MQTRQTIRSVILPSENQVREFDAKLLLAVVLAARGIEVYAGARHVIHNEIARFPQSVYVAKDFRRPSERILDIISGLGHRIVAWDEEGLVQPIPSLYYERRYSLKAMAHVRAVYAWGEANRRLLQQAPAWPGTPVHVTGNPRLDLLRPELRPFFAPAAEALRRDIGAFVLFNSNFASVNPAAGNARPVFGRDTEASSRFLSLRQQMFGQWQDVLPKLAAALAPVRVVIRPHPAERHDVWQALAGRTSNITVRHTGLAVPWMLASTVMVHTGCTTAVESFLLGKPAISYRPEGLAHPQADLADTLSHVLTSSDELIQKVLGVAREGKALAASAAQERAATDAAAARTGQYASDRIADQIAGLLDSGTPGRRSWGSVMAARFRQSEKMLTGLLPGHKTSSATNLLRFPGEHLGVVQQKASALAACLGLEARIACIQISDNVFRIAPDGPAVESDPSCSGRDLAST